MDRRTVAERVAQRPTDGGAERLRPVAAGRRFEVGREVGRRRLRAHIDEPAERIGAVASALRAAQHLDAIDVEQGRDAAETREVDVVDDEADRRIRRAVVLLELADAAQLKVTRARALARKVQVGNAADRFFEVLLRRGTKLGTIEHADADRQIFDARFAKIGRDDDLFERHGLLGLSSRELRQRKRNGGGGAARRANDNDMLGSPLRVRPGF